MKRRIFACLLAVCLLMSSAALSEGEKTICVTATATVSVEADRALLSLGVRTTEADAARASEKNAEQMEALREALLASGVQEGDMSSSSYFVSPLYDYSGETEAIRGYQVSHVLSVLVREMEKTGDLIDLALASGANTCDGVTFQSSQAEAAYDQALVMALKEGTRKAELIAQGNGNQLGDLLSVTENTGSYTGVRSAKEMVMDSAVTGTQITSGGLDFSASVTMVFAFQ